MFNWSLPLWADIAIFLGGALGIGIAGVKAAGIADRFADRTGIGEALTGTIFLGLITALPGLAASVIAAWKGHPALAINNAIGGIAVQTASLAVADIAYPRANLEHAAASAPNLMQAIMLILLLTITLIALTAPEVTMAHVHPMTLALLAAAAFAFYLTWHTHRNPMWQPTRTDETIMDVPDTANEKQSLVGLTFGLVASVTVTAMGGAVVAEAGENLVTRTVLSEAVVGGVFMATATSLPELVTSIAAVRRGALTLAVSDIVGGNLFDILFVAAADLAFLGGSLYHASGIGNRQLFLIGITILLNVVLLMGLIYRQKRGPANIGFESLAIILIYVGGFLMLCLAM